MYKRFNIYVVSLIFISLLGVLFFHSNFIAHCPFCSGSVSNTVFVADSANIIPVKDNSFQLITIVEVNSIPFISQDYISHIQGASATVATSAGVL